MLQKVLEVEDLAVFPTTQGSTIPDFTETNEILLSLCNVRRQKGMSWRDLHAISPVPRLRQLMRGGNLDS